jgi:hypothetical protein
LLEESETLSLLAGVASSALLAGTVASLDSGPVVGFELSSDAEELSSQAFSEKTAAMPRTAAMAPFLATETIVLFLIFFFSIFIFQPFVFFEKISRPRCRRVRRW